MLVNSKEILLNAKKNCFAVPAPDFIDFNSAKAFVTVAEEMNTPIMLSYAQSFKEFLSLEEAVTIGKLVANSVKVPVVLHLDHGEDVECCKRAIDLGFTSVMIDASVLSFEGNVATTREVVEYAKGKNVSVEAEIGHVGQASVGNGEGAECSNTTADSTYTTAEEAYEFVKATGIDSLAVSIGTAHGIYKGLKAPKLNFERLEEISAKVSVPLVLHGGSGTGDDNLNRCATSGISKINIYTDFLTASMKAINEKAPSNYLQLKNIADEAMKNTLAHYIEVFSNKKA